MLVAFLGTSSTRTTRPPLLEGAGQPGKKAAKPKPKPEASNKAPASKSGKGGSGGGGGSRTSDRELVKLELKRKALQCGSKWLDKIEALNAEVSFVLEQAAEIADDSISEFQGRRLV